MMKIKLFNRIIFNEIVFSGGAPYGIAFNEVALNGIAFSGAALNEVAFTKLL